MSSIFSKIVAGEIPCFKVAETEDFLAFLDVFPLRKGHTLIIPKVPSVDGTVTDPDTLAHIMKVGQTIAQALQKVTSCTGVNYIMNNGADAGQEVFHTHLHVIPRHKDDKAFEPIHRKEYLAAEAQDIVEAMQKLVG